MEHTTPWPALAGTLGLAAIILAGCSAGGARSAAAGSGLGAPSQQLSAGAGQQISVRDLITKLTRTGIGPGQVVIDLTYAPPAFFEVTGLPQPAESRSRPTLAFMLQETIHEGTLPDEPTRVLLVSQKGTETPPYDARITATDPHHRTTRLLFPDSGAGFSTAQSLGIERMLKVVVPFADGTKSGANTFVWQLPIDLVATAADASTGPSQ